MTNDSLLYLRHGDVVFFITVSTNGEPGNDVVTHDLVPMLSASEYQRNHYAAPECGYFAVCGKLSADEEEQVFASLIQALCRQPQEVAPENWGVPSLTVVPFKAPRHPFFAAADLHANFEVVMNSWRRHGYIVVELQASVQHAVEEALVQGAKFFRRPTFVKERCKSAASSYLGYKHSPAYGKELFQVRDTFNGPDVVGSLLQDDHMSVVFRRCFFALKSIAEEFGRHMLGTDKMVRLGEAASQEARGPSQSNLTLLHYDSALKEGAQSGFAASTPYHTDVGLVTVIPSCSGSAGLHVWDFSHEEWVGIDAFTPSGSALVFGGETLQKITSGGVLAAVHEVCLPNEGAPRRCSVPFQLLATPGAVIEECNGLTAAQFVQSISQSRISSNFPPRRSAADV
jgi:isopenicillin N synthase-like dioxygenase